MMKTANHEVPRSRISMWLAWICVGLSIAGSAAAIWLATLLVVVGGL